MNTSWRGTLTNRSGKKGKGKILVFPFELLSHYLRTIQLADELRNDFDIRFAGSFKYAKFLRDRAYATFPYEDIDAAMVMEHSRRFDFGWINTQNLEPVLEQQIAVIQQHKPDYVLGDATFTLKIAAEYCGVKYISLLNGYMSKYYACTRRIPHGHPAYKFSKLVSPAWFDKMTNFIEAIVFKKVHEPFSTLRKKYGLKRQSSFLDELEGDITLLCDVPALFPQRNLPGNYYFIGPLYYKGNEPEDDLLKVVTNGKQNILVSMGSTGNMEKLQWLADSAWSDYNIIVSGVVSDNLKAPHIYHQQFINNTALMPYIEVLLCHGGNGTIYQALADGVPVLASTSIFEQEYNMQRIKAMGLGDLIHEGGMEEKRKQLEYWISLKGSSALTEMKAAIASYFH